jgi:hypothetical protein
VPVLCLTCLHHATVRRYRAAVSPGAADAAQRSGALPPGGLYTPGLLQPILEASTSHPASPHHSGRQSPQQQQQQQQPQAGSGAQLGRADIDLGLSAAGLPQQLSLSTDNGDVMLLRVTNVQQLVVGGSAAQGAPMILTATSAAAAAAASSQTAYATALRCTDGSPAESSSAAASPVPAAPAASTHMAGDADDDVTASFDQAGRVSPAQSASSSPSKHSPAAKAGSPAGLSPVTSREQVLGSSPRSSGHHQQQAVFVGYSGMAISSPAAAAALSEKLGSSPSTLLAQLGSDQQSASSGLPSKAAGSSEDLTEEHVREVLAAAAAALQQASSPARHSRQPPQQQASQQWGELSAADPQLLYEVLTAESVQVGRASASFSPAHVRSSLDVALAIHLARRQQAREGSESPTGQHSGPTSILAPADRQGQLSQQQEAPRNQVSPTTLSAGLRIGGHRRNDSLQLRTLAAAGAAAASAAAAPGGQPGDSPMSADSLDFSTPMLKRMGSYTQHSQEQQQQSDSGLIAGLRSDMSRSYTQHSQTSRDSLDFSTPLTGGHPRADWPFSCADDEDVVLPCWALQLHVLVLASDAQPGPVTHRAR